MKPNKDQFEEFVHNNRPDFDLEEPSLDLWNKIEEELGEDKGKVISIDWMLQLRRVAAVIIIGTVSILGYEYLQSDQKVKTTEVAENTDSESINTAEFPNEVKEEMYYYSMRVNSTLAEFNKLTKNSPELNKDVKKDLKELDEDMKLLLKDLQENLDSEEVLEAMIQNYRYRLQVLEDIMNEIKEAKYEDDEQSFDI